MPFPISACQALTPIESKFDLFLCIQRGWIQITQYIRMNDVVRSNHIAKRERLEGLNHLSREKNPTHVWGRSTSTQIKQQCNINIRLMNQVAIVRLTKLIAQPSHTIIPSFKYGKKRPPLRILKKAAQLTRSTFMPFPNSKYSYQGVGPIKREPPS